MMSRRSYETVWVKKQKQHEQNRQQIDCNNSGAGRNGAGTNRTLSFMEVLSPDECALFD